MRGIFEYEFSGELTRVEVLGNNLSRISLDLPTINDRIQLLFPADVTSHSDYLELIYEEVEVEATTQGHLARKRITHGLYGPGDAHISVDTPLYQWRRLVNAARQSSIR